VALGDVNGDGYADVVVGAYYANMLAGAAYVFQSAGAAGVPSGAYNSSANTTLTGAASSYFGYSVALGDVNGDGYADVVNGNILAGRTATINNGSTMMGRVLAGAYANRCRLSVAHQHYRASVS
jgi:hypothetical protein